MFVFACEFTVDLVAARRWQTGHVEGGVEALHQAAARGEVGVNCYALVVSEEHNKKYKNRTTRQVPTHTQKKTKNSCTS